MERGNYRTGRPRGRLIGKAVHYWHLARARYPWYYLLSFFVPIHHRRPIFIVGCPRSGTSLLFRLFMRSPILGSLGREGNRVWEHYHPASEKGWVSHVLDETDVSEQERRFVYQQFYRVAGGRRFVEKTPRNCFRIPYLLELFPDAYIIYLKRDGRDTVNSLMREWRSPRHRTYLLPGSLRIQGYEGAGWKFDLPPGWEAYTGRSLAEVCAFQWVASNQAVLDARRRVSDDQWVEVHYEDIVSSPVEAVRTVCERVQVPWTAGIERYCARIEPRVGQWTGEFREEIVSILPLICPMMDRLGYRMDVDVPAVITAKA